MAGCLLPRLLAQGLRRHGQRLARAFFEAADLFEANRLPECFSGHQRTTQNRFPGIYPRACWPQAWSASAPSQILQSLLGLQPYAPLQLLMLDPDLPEWLPEMSLAALRVGEAVVDLRFRRQNDGTTDFEVLDQRGPLRIVRQANPWSLLDGPPDRVHAMLRDTAA